MGRVERSGDVKAPVISDTGESPKSAVDAVNAEAAGDRGEIHASDIGCVTIGLTGIFLALAGADKGVEVAAKACNVPTGDNGVRIRKQPY